MLGAKVKIADREVELERNGLPSGVYWLLTETDRGLLAKTGFPVKKMPPSIKTAERGYPKNRLITHLFFASSTSPRNSTQNAALFSKSQQLNKYTLQIYNKKNRNTIFFP